MADEELAEQTDAEPTRRGWKRFFVRAAVVIGILLMVSFITRWQMERVSEQKLTEVVTLIDQTEHQWRLEEIEAKRLARMPPPNENAASLVLEIADNIPAEWNQWRETAKWLISTPDNYLPSPERIQELHLHKESTQAIRDRAHAIRDRPTGYYTFKWPDNPNALTLPHLDSAGRVVVLLEYDARLAVSDRDPDRGIRAAHAVLDVARSIGDEPTLVSQNFRMMFRLKSAIAALGTLASTTPTTGLEQLQAAFLADADEPLFLYGVRGERAAFHRMFDGLESGRLRIANLFSAHGEAGTPIANPAMFKLYQPLLPGDHAECMRLYTAFIDVAKRVWHEQREAAAKITMPKETPEGMQYTLTRMVFPPLDRILESSLRNRAHLLIAATAIACERFRQQQGRWPHELSEIPRTILPSIPLSPFDGEPLRYRILPDRIVLTCYCWKAGQTHEQPAEFRDQKAGPVEFRYPESPGFGIAACVWNPDQRGLPFSEKR
ncbi:MAG TPA: hypothetical protein VG122_22180 [Gemmata sp.]|nr:hypothetical protein [Gemmata sp.]